MCCGVKGLNPIGWRHAGLKQQGASSVIDGMNHALGFTVLRRGVWGGHAQVNTVGEEKGARAGVVELTSVVALDGFDHHAELCANIGDEVCQCGKSVRHNTERKIPQIMRAVIKNKQIVFESRNTSNW